MRVSGSKIGRCEREYMIICNDPIVIFIIEEGYRKEFCIKGGFRKERMKEEKKIQEKDKNVSINKRSKLNKILLYS